MPDDADYPVPTLLGEVVYFIQPTDRGEEVLCIVGMPRDEYMQDHSEAAFFLRLLNAICLDKLGAALGLWRLGVGEVHSAWL